MSDLYSECLVKKEPTAKDAAVKYGLIVLIVLCAAAGAVPASYFSDRSSRSGHSGLFYYSGNRSGI